MLSKARLIGHFFFTGFRYKICLENKSYSKNRNDRIIISNVFLRNENKKIIGFPFNALSTHKDMDINARYMH